MFVCKECGAEYEIKPDYCECGNDTFDEVVPEIKKVEKKEEQKQVSHKKVKPVKYDSFYYEKLKNFFDPISTIFFIICVILSFIIILYVGNPDEQNNVPQPKTVQKQATTMPQIDKIWNDTPPVIKKEVEVKPQEVKPQPEIKKIIEQPKKEIKKKIETRPIKKFIEQKKVVTPKSVQPKTVAPVQPRTVAPVQPKPQVTKTTTQPVQVNKQELLNYKMKLRNYIASKIDFASIVGDGTCAVSFKVAASGELTNKKFVQQSQNFSLNDVVYNALLKATHYNPPPTSYNGGTLKMTVQIYDGDFEVSLY